jgi:uncharacterized membrane protein YfcA
MEILLILITVIIASGVGTLTGFGLSSVLVPVMLLFYPLAETLLFVGIVHWFGDLWKILLFREGIRWKLVAAFGIPGVIATVIGASLVVRISAGVLSRILGVFLLLYVVFLLARSSFKLKQSLGTSVLGGAMSGFFAGIFGMGGAIRGMFLSAFNLPKAVYLATAGTIAIVIDTSRLIEYLREGTRLMVLPLWSMLLFIPASFMGARMAKQLVDRIPQEHFRKVVAFFLLAIGLKMLIRP